MSSRWSLYLVIDGYSACCGPESEMLVSVDRLMQAAFRMGRYGCPKHPQQLFVLQCGDGFLIASEFHEVSLDRCTCIAAALMQHLGLEGRWTRGAISEGELIDQQDTEPPELQASLVEDHTYSLHMGLMNASPVMGTALVRPMILERTAPRGPLLWIRQSRAGRLGPGITVRSSVEAPGLGAIDWVHLQSPLLDKLRNAAGLRHEPIDRLEQRLGEFCLATPLPDDWISNVQTLLRIPALMQNP